MGSSGDILLGRILVLTDPNLAEQVAGLLAKFLPSAVMNVWRRGDRFGAHQIRETIRSGGWAGLLSVYNDLILVEKDLAVLPFALNVHPALPHLPGMGHDILPLVRCDSSHGATLHFMQHSVDSGPVVEVERRPVGHGWGYPEIRAANQAALLALFGRLLERIASAPSASGFLPCEIERAAQSGLRWSGPYTSAGELLSVLRRVLAKDPDWLQAMRVPVEFLDGIGFGESGLAGQTV